MSTIQLITEKLTEAGKTGTDLCIYLELPRATLQNWKSRKSHSYMTRLKEIGKFLGVSVKELRAAADEKEKAITDGKGKAVKTEEAKKAESTVKKAAKTEEAAASGKKSAEPTVKNEKAKKAAAPVKPTEKAPKSEPSSEDLLAEMDKVFPTLPYEAQIVLVNNAKLMKKV